MLQTQRDAIISIIDSTNAIQCEFREAVDRIGNSARKTIFDIEESDKKKVRVNHAPKLSTEFRAKNRHQLPSITAVDLDKNRVNRNRQKFESSVRSVAI